MSKPGFISVTLKKLQEGEKISDGLGLREPKGIVGNRVAQWALWGVGIELVSMDEAV